MMEQVNKRMTWRCAGSQFVHSDDLDLGPSGHVTLTRFLSVYSESMSMCFVLTLSQQQSTSERLSTSHSQPDGGRCRRSGTSRLSLR